VSQGIFRAEGKCLRAGRNLLFSEARVLNAAGELICTASSQLMIVPMNG
jgi:acyl-coenzyme A thioesterase PaaI-like protein